MISITVLLAAIVGTMSLGLGSESMRESPQASLSVSVSPSSDEINLRHSGGDRLFASETRLQVTVVGTDATFEPIDSDAGLAVGSTAVIDTAGNDEVDWNGDGTVEAYTPSGGADVLPAIDSGDVVTVRLVDTESQVVFFETDVTA